MFTEITKFANVCKKGSCMLLIDWQMNLHSKKHVNERVKQNLAKNVGHVDQITKLHGKRGQEEL